MEISENAVFELIGRQSVEIDQLRRQSAALVDRIKKTEPADRCMNPNCDCAAQQEEPKNAEG